MDFPGDNRICRWDGTYPNKKEPNKKPECWCETESVFNEKSHVHIGLLEWDIKFCPVCGKKL